MLQANGRCDQENLIEQLKNGVSAMKLPVDNLLSNWAYMVMASLAWSLKAWWGLMLPVEGRWRQTPRAGETRRGADGVQAVRGRADPPAVPDHPERPAAVLSTPDLQPVAVGVAARRGVLADASTMLTDHDWMPGFGRSDSPRPCSGDDLMHNDNPAAKTVVVKFAADGGLLPP